jgi:hypothetical protein
MQREHAILCQQGRSGGTEKKQAWRSSRRPEERLPPTAFDRALIGPVRDAAGAQDCTHQGTVSGAGRLHGASGADGDRVRALRRRHQP